MLFFEAINLGDFLSVFMYNKERKYFKECRSLDSARLAFSNVVVMPPGGKEGLIWVVILMNALVGNQS